MKKYIFLLLIGSPLSACSEKDDSTLLAPKAFQQRFQETPNAVLLDVRTLEEVEAGRIKGEINFDFKAPEFDVLIKGLDKTKPYFVYCASGVRSAKVAAKMESEGFEKVYLLEGGIKAWEAEGLPVQK